MGEKIIIQNRRARHDYHVIEKHEAGIELRGTEVKSLRAGHIVLKDAYADVDGGEMFLVGVHINPYEQGTVWNHEPERRRKLLMHKREIMKLAREVQQKGVTLVPLKIYFKNGKAKLLVGLAKGKTAVDKRHSIAKRESDRDIARAMSKRM